MKRWLYLLHRWLGVLLCLFMAMWFVSGVVMMYVGYPKLTHEERQLALPKLGDGCCAATWQQVLPGTGSEVRALRLSSVAGRATYIVTPHKGAQWAVDATTGQRTPQAGVEQALASAQAFMPGVVARHEAIIDEDAWTHSKALEAQRPLHRIAMADADDTVLYVSARTGEVVRDASGTERLWNWVGAWIHWLYPFRGGAVDHYWSEIVIYTSIVATVLSLVGLLVGVWRWRFGAPYARGQRTPYRSGWMRWHHVVGLLFGLTTVTFIFSGLMSMNPFRVLDSGAPRVDTRARHATGIPTQRLTLSARDTLQSLRAAGFAPVELEWRMQQGRPLVLAFDGTGASRMVWGDASGAAADVFESFSMAQMEQLGRSLMPGQPVHQATVLSEFDFYYYQRKPHTMSGGPRHLPILRLEFDDPHRTWLHLDPRTGAVVGQLDSHRRVGRWLFAFLHSWDWLPLLERRPLWDIWMWLMSIGGLVLSASGVVIGWRRLRVKFARGPTPATVSKG